MKRLFCLALLTFMFTLPVFADSSDENPVDEKNENINTSNVIAASIDNINNSIDKTSIGDTSISIFTAAEDSFDTGYTLSPLHTDKINPVFIQTPPIKWQMPIKQNSVIADQSSIQGSYIVISYNALNIAVTAKIETIEDSANTGALPQQFNNYLSNFSPLERGTNKTLGLVGSYQLNANWSIVGAVTATDIAEDLATTALFKQENAHMAVIGTSYSF